ncbi:MULTISPECIES: class I SAM-dependent methyltransferase [unclassified Bradyrhizobium]|uniref:class I SAM-dependent methyltransferase n=1 Tax=unclassified Bradyrhizobium TaxID=2631580 RepID=UPI0029164589|nr:MULTISPECIES: methyltransferase domain-containing protein [unclassified Bradyrhizobium]
MDAKIVDFGVALHAMNGKANVGLGAAADLQKERFKSAVATFYDLSASASVSGEVWNWGMYDEVIDNQISALIPGYNKHGSDGFSEQLYFFAVKAIPMKVRDYQNKRVLEVGSGLGYGLNFISRIMDASFVGLDLSAAAIERATAAFARRNVQFFQGDAEHLPFDTSEFDVVVNIESSHNYPDLGRFITEVGRVLKPGGYFSHADLYTRERHELLTTLKQSYNRLDWLSERDISQKVKSAISKRLAPGSFFRNMRRAHSAAAQTPEELRKAEEHFSEAMFGAAFLLGQHFPSQAGSRSLAVQSYRHSLAIKV